MRGIELMLMGIYAVSNITDVKKNGAGNFVLPDRFNCKKFCFVMFKYKWIENFYFYG